MTEPTTTIEQTAETKPARRSRKSPDQWKKTARYKVIKEMEPDFISKAELARHLCCHVQTITGWISDGTIPPPHSAPGLSHPIWLRRHYRAFVETGQWPDEAWPSRRKKRSADRSRP